MADGYLNFDTRINTSGFDKGKRSIGSGLDSLKSQLKGIAGAVAAAFSVKKLLEFSKQAVESAAEINAANSQLAQTFGTLQNQAEEAMQRVADASGIVVTRLKGVGTSIYAFAKTSGMDSAAALSMMEDALQVAADSAAYYDRSLEDVSETLKSFLKGNYANDAALGISCTETTRNAAANKLYGKSFIELSEAQKQLTLLQMVKDANDLSGATGQAAREAEGWENVLGNLKETWKQLLGVVGQPMLKVATSAVQRLTSALETLTEKARAAVAAVYALFGWEQDATADVSANISGAVTAQEELTEEAEETNDAYENSLASFDKITTLKSSEEGEKKKDKKAALVTPAIAPKVDENKTEKAVDKLSEKIKAKFEMVSKPFKIAWKDNSKQIIDNFKKAAESIKLLFSSLGSSFEKIWQTTAFKDLIGNILTGFNDVLLLVTSFANALTNAWNDSDRGTQFLMSFVQLWNSILELVHTFSSDLLDVWNNGTGEKMLGNILDIITGINGIVKNLITSFTVAWKTNDVGKRIIQKIFDIGNKFLECVKNIVNSTKEWASHLDFTPLLESIDHLLDSIKNAVGVFGNRLEWVWKNLVLPVGKWLIEVLVPAVVDFAALVLDFSSCLAGDIDKNISDFFKNFKDNWEDLKDFFPTLWEDISDAFKDGVNWIIDKINGLIDCFSDGINWIIDGLNSAFSFSIPDNVPVVGGTSFDLDLSGVTLPRIPQLAQGTVVPPNYGNFLALLGDNKREAEIVSPLSTMEKAVANVLSRYMPKELVAYISMFPNSAAARREIIKLINDDARNRGGY